MHILASGLVVDRLPEGTEVLQAVFSTIWLPLTHGSCIPPDLNALHLLLKTLQTEHIFGVIKDRLKKYKGNI